MIGGEGISKGVDKERSKKGGNGMVVRRKWKREKEENEYRESYKFVGRTDREMR